MVGAVASIEETSPDGDKGIVVLTAGNRSSVYVRMSNKPGVPAFERDTLPNAPLEKAVPMAVNGIDGVRIRDADMVRLYAYQRSVFLVGFVDGLVPFSEPALEE